MPDVDAMSLLHIDVSSTSLRRHVPVEISAAMGFLLGTQERVRNSRGVRAMSVRATEGLSYLLYFPLHLLNLYQRHI